MQLTCKIKLNKYFLVLPTLDHVQRLSTPNHVMSFGNNNHIMMIPRGPIHSMYL